MSVPLPKRAAAAAFVLSALLCSDAFAQLVDASDPARIADAIRELGYRAAVDADNVGDPLIRSSAGGTDFLIYFFGCKQAQACTLLLFKAGYELPEPVTTERVNAWNEGTLLGRAYVDENGSAWLEMPLNMDGGISRLNFDDGFDWWEVILRQFEEHIGY